MSYCRLMDDDLPGNFCTFCGAPLQRECLDSFELVCEESECIEDSWWADTEDEWDEVITELDDLDDVWFEEEPKKEIA